MGDEFGLCGGLWQRPEEFVRRRQDTCLDDIDVGRFLHGGGKLRVRAGRQACDVGRNVVGATKARAMFSGKNKAGRLPLTGPLLLS